MATDCGASRFYSHWPGVPVSKVAPRVDRLVAHPDDADPGHDHHLLHCHHTPCAVIGNYKPCRHSIVEVNLTITAADEPILVR